MKYSPEDYAKAFSEIIAATADAKKEDMFKRFIAVIQKNGDGMRLKKILQVVRAVLVRQQGGRVVKLETARPMAEKALAELREKFTAKDYVEAVENSLLIAGVRVTVNGEEELDNTLSRKLKRLFK